MEKIKLGYDPKTEEIHIEKMKVDYSQKCDQTSEHWQVLSIETEDNGGGAYFVIKTERWAFDKIQELIDTLEDFKRRAGI